jgi:hypothetical protein
LLMLFREYSKTNPSAPLSFNCELRIAAFMKCCNSEN